MSDLASFDLRHVIDVFGDYPQCVLSSVTSNIEFHHILGRGGKRKRKLMSSIFNCAPLFNSIHASSSITDPMMQKLLLSIVSRIVHQRVGMGLYTLTDNDHEFLEYVNNLFLEGNVSYNLPHNNPTP